MTRDQGKHFSFFFFLNFVTFGGILNSLSKIFFLRLVSINVSESYLFHQSIIYFVNLSRERQCHCLLEVHLYIHQNLVNFFLVRMDLNTNILISHGKLLSFLNLKFLFEQLYRTKLYLKKTYLKEVGRKISLALVVISLLNLSSKFLLILTFLQTFGISSYKHLRWGFVFVNKFQKGKK